MISECGGNQTYAYMYVYVYVYVYTYIYVCVNLFHISISILLDPIDAIYNLTLLIKGGYDQFLNLIFEFA